MSCSVLVLLINFIRIKINGDGLLKTEICCMKVTGLILHYLADHSPTGSERKTNKQSKSANRQIIHLIKIVKIIQRFRTLDVDTYNLKSAAIYIRPRLAHEKRSSSVTSYFFCVIGDFPTHKGHCLINCRMGLYEVDENKDSEARKA